MTLSKKHHYIPRFYLKGFTDKENKYFVYDKNTGNIYRSNPENTFAENHRNTAIIEDQNTKELRKMDLAEHMLSRFDSKAASALHDIVNSSPEDSILSPERLYAIQFLIFSVFWRTPINDGLRNAIIKNLSFKDLGFGIFDEKTGKRHIETEEMLRGLDAWVKLYPALLPISSFTKKFNKINKDEWRIYYHKTDLHIITDNPIIFHKEFKDLSSLQEELIVPLSSKILLIATKKTKPKNLPPIFNLQVDLLLFHQAGRYAASSDKTHLEFLAKTSKEYLTNPGWSEKLKETIFNHF
jgi:hypothetical protein